MRIGISVLMLKHGVMGQLNATTEVMNFSVISQVIMMKPITATRTEAAAAAEIVVLGKVVVVVVVVTTTTKSSQCSS